MLGIIGPFSLKRLISEDRWKRVATGELCAIIRGNFQSPSETPFPIVHIKSWHVAQSLKHKQKYFVVTQSVKSNQKYLVCQDEAEGPWDEKLQGNNHGLVQYTKLIVLTCIIFLLGVVIIVLFWSAKTKQIYSIIHRKDYTRKYLEAVCKYFCADYRPQLRQAG
jgi:hypothetical protein